MREQLSKRVARDVFDARALSSRATHDTRVRDTYPQDTHSHTIHVFAGSWGSRCFARSSSERRRLSRVFKKNKIKQRRPISNTPERLTACECTRRHYFTRYFFQGLQRIRFKIRSVPRSFRDSVSNLFQSSIQFRMCSIQFDKGSEKPPLKIDSNSCSLTV